MPDKRVRILIVDDNKMTLRMIQGVLQHLGFSNVDKALDGSEALTLLRGASPPYALVISDWNMEPMSGLDFLRELRADAALRATPFIMLTSADTQDSVLTAIQAGVSNYIVKPFAPNTLKAKIASVLGPF